MHPSMYLPRKKVLVIDDSPELLDVFKAILERQGYEIIAKSSPRDIHTFVKNNRIDILFLDVILQSINGKTICKELKSNALTSYFPIVLMSTNPAYIKDFREHDADACIEKPFDISSLIKKINSLTKKKRLT